MTSLLDVAPVVPVVVLEDATKAVPLARDGPNEVQHEPPLPGWLRLWRCYLNPFNLLLTALALLSILSADAKADGTDEVLDVIRAEASKRSKK